MTYILGIESTCDETACAIVKDGTKILSSIVTSQIEIHSPYGGVVPEIACRHHIDTILPVIKEAEKQAGITIQDIDAIAVANCPGLIGAILIGLNVAKGISLALNKPLIGVNHIEAHLYAAIMETTNTPTFPALGLVISGGHTALIEIESIGNYNLLGKTVDDAIGEAFDKVATLLQLPYPGGPHIEALAKDGDPSYYSFKPGKVKGRPLDFSFSGLKTKALYTAKGPNTNKHSPLIISEEEKKHIAASFQYSAFLDLSQKIETAIKQKQYNALIVGGGVANSQTLRRHFEKQNFPFPTFWPPKGLSLDNAAMIAGLGYHHYLKNPKGDPLTLEAHSKQNLS